MEARTNTQHKTGSTIAVFTDSRPATGSQFEILDSHQNVINIAQVQSVQLARLSVTQPRGRYQVTAVIVA